MSRFIVLFLLVLCQVTWGHHSEDHMILTADTEQVIAATREGSGADWLWLMVPLVLVFGILRWLRSK